MVLPSETQAFQEEWFNLAKVIVARVAADPEIVAMYDDFKASKSLTFEQRSQFIAITNKVKGQVLHETYGPEESDSFKQFQARWRNWYDTKGVTSALLGDRRLTNEEHIVYSSTPEAVEFFINIERSEKNEAET